MTDPTAAQIEYAEHSLPSDAELSELYDRSCRLCHAVEGMNAPLTGHGADWAARMKAREGVNGLLNSAKYGYQMMPANGQCFDCSDDQFIALIEFMAKDGGS
ncbi:c-type cytochrome [Henriciella litoralis]|uniref:c-type cytochrome n=1 Tax=Henriciella litoralis TaxID=568102 RepID=UPI00146E4B5A|nr:c-type cytochrome [Henriciella litoralis]